MKVACLMMQKNEDNLLGPWIEYYSKLFGPENLFVYDNGSTSPVVYSVLKRAAEKGVHVFHEYSEKADFENKGNIIAEKIQELDELDVYDFFFPLDCDEFVGVMKADGEASFEREDIYAELEP